MSKQVTIDTSELFSFLDKLTGRAGIVIGEILLESAIDAESKAKELSPIDTGRLRSSIHWESREGKSPGKKFDTRPQAGEILVGSNVTYAAINEFKHANASGFLRGGFDYALGRMSQRLAKLDLDE